MLDKSIPYLNILMQRKAEQTVPEYTLPEGFSFVPFTQGAEIEWAEIEASVDEFDSAAEALEYFQKEYLTYPGEVERRTIFIETKDHKKVATVTTWWNYTGDRRDPALHWVAVMPEYQRMGLGRAVVFESVQRMLAIEGHRDMYLHTQTWSHRAIKIYLQAGFEFMKTGSSFGGYENEIDKALPYLREKQVWR